MFRDGMLNIPDRLAAVLAAETDPRQVHELLGGRDSQSADGVLPMPTGLTADEIYSRTRRRKGALPDPLLTVSEWADTYRTLSQRASAEPGPWRTDRTPYLREIMDCLSPSSPVETVVLMKGAQIGGTECGNNWIGYVVHQAPGPMLSVQPTVEMAKRNSKQRVDPLIEESPVLRELVKRSAVPRLRQHDAGERIPRRAFSVMTGANSPPWVCARWRPATCSSTRWTPTPAMSTARVIPSTWRWPEPARSRGGRCL
jgi:hypothetical protein